MPRQTKKSMSGLFSYKRLSNKSIINSFLITLSLLSTSFMVTAAQEQSHEALQRTSTGSISGIAPQHPEAEALLNQLHLAATNADWDTYFNVYLPEATFIGTDAAEHWNMAEFEGYARPTDGWHYTLKSRTFVSINTASNDQVLMFDELLDSASYGLCRGTGTLIKRDNRWKVAQYHLSFPIPNNIAKEITARIKVEK